MAVNEALRNCRMFNKLEDDELKQIEAITERRMVRKRDYVCKEGAWGESMFIIDQGEVEISRKIGAHESVVIATMRHGDAFGEVALFDGSARTANVNTTTNSSVLEIHAREFHKLLSENPAIARKVHETIIKILIDRLKATDEKVARLTRETTGKGAPGSALDAFKAMLNNG